jgi:hypothetical protein
MSFNARKHPNADEREEQRFVQNIRKKVTNIDLTFVRKSKVPLAQAEPSSFAVWHHRPNNWKGVRTDRVALKSTRSRVLEALHMIDSDSIVSISVVYLISQYLFRSQNDQHCDRPIVPEQFPDLRGGKGHHCFGMTHAVRKFRFMLFCIVDVRGISRLYRLWAAVYSMCVFYSFVWVLMHWGNDQMFYGLDHNWGNGSCFEKDRGFWRNKGCVWECID